MDDTGQRHEVTHLPPVKDFKETHVTIKGCSRCLGTHEKLLFKPFTHPPMTGHNAWALCPTNGEPIYMTVFADLAQVQADLRRQDLEEKKIRAAHDEVEKIKGVLKGGG